MDRIAKACLLAGLMAAIGCTPKPGPASASPDPFDREYVLACPIDGPMSLRVTRKALSVFNSPDTSFPLDFPFTSRSQDSLFYSGMGFHILMDAQGKLHYYFIDCERCHDWSDALHLEVIPRAEFRPDGRYEMGGEDNTRTCTLK